MSDLLRQLESIYGRRADGRYGLEDISQLQHALQTAALAEAQGEAPALVLAALLHDVGHMVHGLGDNPAAEGVDDRHEIVGADWLAARLPSSVSEPVRLHVAAKRYLCGTEPDYAARLAPDSVLSLSLQGGPMTEAEAARFKALPHADAAIRLRRLDDTAKDPAAATPPVGHFLRHLPAARIGSAERDAFRRDGFVVLRGALSDRDVAQVAALSGAMGRTAAAQLARARRRGVSPAELARRDGGLIVVPEAGDPAQVCRFEYLIGSDAAFAALVAACVAPPIEGLAGERFIPFKDKENEKHPGGGAFRPHQDFAAYRAFGPRYNITAMLSIDPATRANGCVEFAAGWMAAVRADPTLAADWIDGRALLRCRQGGAFNGDVMEEIADRLAWTAVETAPADLVLFDSFVPHRSAPNRTGRSRRAMFLTFNAAREGDWYARYYADKRANFDDPKFHVSTPTAHK
ncbi:MAG TPA: phytanoyl-CoA dioxygenase family protein [Rhizomicrobium sp.]